MIGAMPKPGAKPLSDPTELRALAHPLRVRLLTELTARGEGTVSDLAAAVDTPVNKVSFHLHQLAKYGFIEPAPERARDRRDRWWRPAYDEGIDWDRLLAEPGTAPVARSRMRRGMSEALEAIRSYFSRAVGNLPDWQRGDFAHDWYLQLTADEAAGFDEEYLQLCRRWQERTRRRIAEGDTEGRRQVGIFIFGFPVQDRW